ncbi:dimethyl sulfoxide reductase anchor subunit [soil metagenome]
MHPAPSIIVFTTLSGMGFGLIAVLSLGLVASGSGAIIGGAALAIALSGGGLLASLAHLGHPERAWRALSQWRTSWLSREGVLAIATLAAFGAYAGAWILLGVPLAPLGLITALIAAATVYATAMIYASIRAVAAWHHPLIPVCYLGFAAAGGTLLAALVARAAGQDAAGLEVAAALILAASWAVKALWWGLVLPRGFGASSPETATGLGRIGRVRLFEAPHTAPNYLMKEMVFSVGRRHGAKLRALAMILGGVLPAAALVASLGLGGAWPLLLLGAASHTLGMLAERWLFFAEARHAVALYYGGRAPA